MKFLRQTFALLVVVLACQTLVWAQDPLPSWNDDPPSKPSWHRHEERLEAYFAFEN